MLGTTYATTVVLVDADHRSRARLAADLGGLGYGVGAAASGLAGVEQALEEACDFVVVALPMPDMTPLQFLGMVRAVGSLPVLVIAAGGEGAVPLLEAGADDVVTRPVTAPEVDARIRAVLRRARPGAGEAPVVRVGDLEIDPGAREAALAGRPLDLTRKEFDLLLALARRPGRVVGKRELLAEVWRQPFGGSDKTVDVHLSWLRRKLGETAAEPAYLRTVRGVGVRLVDPAAGRSPAR